MNHIDFSNLGGMPFTQDRANFMQQTYLAAFGAIANLCGNKTILFGVVSDGVNVTDGWISYNGELIPFIGAALASDVVITETSVPFTFANTTIHNVQFTKVATCGLTGAFPFADLVPLLSLQNVWKKDDIRQCMKDAAYEAANFDGSGYGTTAAEKGWRILSKVYADAAGAALVNKKTGDADFGNVGDHPGVKQAALTPGQLPVISANLGLVKINGLNTFTSGDSSGGEFDNKDAYAWPGAGDPVSKIQPSFVVLTLIKL